MAIGHCESWVMKIRRNIFAVANVLVPGGVPDAGD
jgi:hypothetical protein